MLLQSAVGGVGQKASIVSREAGTGSVSGGAGWGLAIRSRKHQLSSRHVLQRCEIQNIIPSMKPPPQETH